MGGRSRPSGHRGEGEVDPVEGGRSGLREGREE